MAMDIAQVPPEAVVCIEDQPMFAEAAKSLGIRTFQHVNEKFTRETLAASTCRWKHDPPCRQASRAANRNNVSDCA